jgi:hypothetical protein
MNMKKLSHNNQLLFGLLCSNMLAGVAQAQQPMEWRVQDGGNGHWYQRVPVTGGVGWGFADERAKSAGGYLVSITSAAENALLVAHGAQGYDLLGASTPATQGCYTNTWNWASGEAWGYTNWALYEPSLHCDERVLVFSSAYFPKWNNFYGGSNGYWIEWSADCNGDGMVDFGQILNSTIADTNTNGVPDTCECTVYPTLPGCCPGDLSGDHVVDGADIGLLLSSWGYCAASCPHDLNHDGMVNGGDLGLLLSGWGNCGG